MNNVQNVTVGKPKKTGAIFVAPIGTALPTSVSEEKAEAFKAVGFISEDGLTNSNSATTSNIKAWGGDIVLVTQDEKPDTFQFAMIETLNKTPMEVVYGYDNVTGDIDSGITIKANSNEQEDKSWIIDMVMRNGVLKRIVIPIANVSELGDIVYRDNEAVTYNVTLAAKPDEAGNTHYEYIIDPGAEPVTVYYTVLFDSNGGSAVNGQIVAEGGTVAEPTDPTKEDYTFTSWCSDQALTTVYDFSAEVTADMTLYAKWTEV